MGYFRYTKQLRVYRRRLPHWEIADGIYFVTFCLQDSVPRKEYERSQRRYRESHEWLRSKKADAAAFEALFEHFLTGELDALLDAGYGDCALGNDEVARVLWDSIHHFDGIRYEIIAVAIMPNHVHVIFRLLPGTWTFASIVGGWKSFTFNEVRKTLDIYLGWQDECFDRVIRDERELFRCIEYVLNNPTHAGLDDWRWVGASPQFLATE